MAHRRVFLNTAEPLDEPAVERVEHHVRTGLIDAEIASMSDGEGTYFVLHLFGDHAGAFDLQAFLDETEYQCDVEFQVVSDELTRTA